MVLLERTAPATIFYQRPEYLDFQKDFREPTIATYTDSKNFLYWFIGFDKPKPAKYVQPIVKNPTKISYELAIGQFVENSHSRQLSSGTMEYIETLPMGDFWLSKSSLYGLKEKVPPGGKETLFKLFDDTPKVDIGELLPKKIVRVTANASYKAILFARPIFEEETLEFWCPLRVFSWGWEGEAESKGDFIWQPVEGSLRSMFPTSLSPSEVPTWRNVANKKTLKWRERR